ncbi:MAG: hypothetical protein Q8S75_05530 [Nitrospirota bacterium]|nr:hypothetical protein [Nitrospirota bacterium]
MVTTQRVRILSALGLGGILLVAPAWAELDDRVGFPLPQGQQPGVVYEGQLHGTGTHRGGPSSGEYKAGHPNRERVRGRVDGSRTTTANLPSEVHVRPGDVPTHAVGGGGMPAWRW